MPLRVRLIALVGLVLLASLAGGSVLVGWHAASSVRTELRAALDVGANTIRNGFDDLARSDDRANELRHLVATFNGNRHVRATLLDAEGSPVATSRLFAPSQRVPGWVLRLIADPPRLHASRSRGVAMVAARSSCRRIRSTRSARSGRSRVTRCWCSPASLLLSALLTVAVPSGAHCARSRICQPHSSISARVTITARCRSKVRLSWRAWRTASMSCPSGSPWRRRRTTD